MNAAESFWLASTDDPDYPSLENEIYVPVAVVGGGIAGLTTALELQRAGQTVVLLEAQAIGHGVTGHTTGKLTAGQGLAYSRLESDWGADVALRYATAQTAALEHTFALAEEFDIDCDLERVTNYVFAESNDEVEALDAEAAAAIRAGVASEVVAGLDVPFTALAALRLEGQGQFHARKYLLGLARAFVGAGGRIFQSSRVHAIENHATPGMVELTVRATSVYARDVVLATHVPITMRGWFFARVHPHAAYAVAAPVAADALDGMWINIGAPTHSLRTTPLDDGRRLLIVIGEGHRVGQEKTTTARYEALAEYLTTYFPDADIVYRWTTQDQYPVDGLPYIGRVGDSVYVATGFAGWGLTNGTLAGMILSDAIQRRDNEWKSLFDPNRSSLVRAPRAMLTENLNVAKQLLAGNYERGPILSTGSKRGQGPSSTSRAKKSRRFATTTAP